MNVILVDPPRFSETGRNDKCTPHIGIAYLAAVLDKIGVSPTVYDCLGDSHDEIEQNIFKSNPEVVGLTAMTFNITSAAEIARRVKLRDEGITTIIGGSHVSSIPEQTLWEFPQFDIGVIGEGEETLQEIIRSKGNGVLNGLKDINGIVYRHGSEVITNRHRTRIKDLDSLPMPAWNHFDFSIYNKERVLSLGNRYTRFPVCGSRGCPYDCTFCFPLHGKKWRARNPKGIVGEMEFDYDTYGARWFEIIDSTSTLIEARMLAFCDEIVKRGLETRISWMCETRVDRVDSKLLRRMHDAGCRYVFFGIESGDAYILNRIKKGISPQQIKDAIRAARSVGMHVGGSFIIGHPYEKKENVIATVSLAKDLSRMGLSLANFFILDVYPATSAWNMVEKQQGGAKWIKGKRYNWDSYNRMEPQVEVNDLSAAELLRLRAWAEHEFRNATTTRRLRSMIDEIFERNDWLENIALRIISHYYNIKNRRLRPL